MTGDGTLEAGGPAATTLAVTVPSAHTGGELVSQHGGQVDLGPCGAWIQAGAATVDPDRLLELLGQRDTRAASR
jgi:hypothetical protein